ncbi:MAG: PPC domain-containing protein [Kofleriaceae bacterium]|nr:PPC domain-containing protein [Kofleriaceae bacterium]
MRTSWYSISPILLLIALAACGPSSSAPVLQQVNDQLVAVNQELVIPLSASDEDGDEIFYSFSSSVPEIYSRATLNRLPVGTSEFRWTPEARDVGTWFFDFEASDGQGSDTITIQIEVRSAVGGNSAPKFIHPQGSGTTLDLEVSQCIALQVEVSDSDSSMVTLAQAVPRIEGATLDNISGHEATWNWCPSEAQIAADDRYTLLLSADDGDNPVTLHPYLVVLRSPLKPNCPGDPPVITHSAEDISSLTGLRVEATITDDVGLKKEPLLYYSSAQPSVPPDFSQMIQLTMEEVGDSSLWFADVPNPVVGQAVGSTADIYYIMVADDDDDAMGDCDHRISAPVTGSFKMTVTNPSGMGGAALCESCTADVQCGESGDLCVVVGSSSSSFCLEDCSATTCPDDYECSATPVASVDGATGRQCIPVSQDCSDPSGTLCADDAAENNDSRLEAETNPVLAADTAHMFVSCPALSGVGDDEDFYQIVIAEEALVDVSLIGASVSDLDLALQSDTGGVVQSSVSLQSAEMVSACLQPGTYYLRVYAFSPEENPYTLSYTVTPQSCSILSCQDDVNEDDDDAASAQVPDLSQGPVTLASQEICDGDADWYAIPLTAMQLVSVDLTFAAQSNGDLDVHFYSPASVDLTPCSPTTVNSCDATNGQSATANETAIFEATSAGTYFVVIQGFDDDENSYTIRLETD